MGSPKALLATPDGRPFVVAIVETLRSAGIDDVVVVTGAAHAQVASALASARTTARPVRNPDPSRGQLSSLWVGMDAAISSGTEGLMVTLVDVPLLQPETIARVVGVWHAMRAPVVRPARGGRHGHPVIFDRAIFDELRDAPLAGGAKLVVHRHASELIDVPVDDEGCLVDIDTPADYEAMRRRD